MDYETAKKLRDSGFPQEGATQCEHFAEITKEPISTLEIIRHDVSCEKIKYPTLDELIEACGDKFYKLQIGTSLMGDRNVWYAYMNEETGMIGDTPSEAVANLWLALQDKK